jgi:hypothetical protein
MNHNGTLKCQLIFQPDYTIISIMIMAVRFQVLTETCMKIAVLWGVVSDPPDGGGSKHL